TASHSSRSRASDCARSGSGDRSVAALAGIPSRSLLDRPGVHRLAGARKVQVALDKPSLRLARRDAVVAQGGQRAQLPDGPGHAGANPPLEEVQVVTDLVAR